MSYYSQGPPGGPPPGSRKSSHPAIMGSVAARCNRFALTICADSPYPPQHQGGYPPPQQPYGQPGYQQGPPPHMNQGYGPPPGQAPYPPHGQAPYGGPPPGQFHQPPPGQYGQPPPGQYGGYGAPAPPAPPSAGYIPGQQSHVDMSRAADDLRAAMKGFGTDEKTLVRVLGSLGPLEIESVKVAFQARHRRDLMKDVHSETSGYFREGLEAILRGPMDQDCHALYESVKGVGTKESAMNDVLLGRSNADLNAIRNHYQHKYRRTLESDVKGDLSMKTERLFDMVMTARRAEESTPVIPQQVDQDVQEIYRATEGKAGTDQLTVCSIISSRSNAQIRAISHAYKQKYHRSLEENFRKEFSGHMEDALLFMVRSAEDPAKHDADLLEDAMKGLGTKDSALVRRIVMIHWNPDRLQQAKAAYKHFYKQDLAARIKSETSGDYEKLMLACIGVQNPYESVESSTLRRLEGTADETSYEAQGRQVCDVSHEYIRTASLIRFVRCSWLPGLTLQLPILEWHYALAPSLEVHKLVSMLHRSNSVAMMPERLRRGNAIASGNTSSSAAHNTPKSFDPFVTGQAEVAAAEAYLRSRRGEATRLAAQPPVPSKLRRHKSQAGGKMEGSHFADARNGLRRATSTKDDKVATKTALQRSQGSFGVTDTDDEQPGVITRKRAVIPPNSYSQPSQQDHLPLPTSSRPQRKSQTGYTDGSPMARNHPNPHGRGTVLQSGTPLKPSSTNVGTGDRSEPPKASTTPGTTSLQSTYIVVEPQAAQDTVDHGRDKVLQDFQQRKVRERRSFLVGPFQKRRANDSLDCGLVSRDSSLPPFNYAADPTMAPAFPEPVPIATEYIAGSGPKSRTFSSTLKNRFSKMFRKTSKTRSEIPPQHINSSYCHYPSGDTADPSSNEIMIEKNTFTNFSCNNTPALLPLNTVSDIDNGRLSAAPPSTAKSRVTSWTNSTIGTTWSSGGGDRVFAVNEHGVRERSQHGSELKRSDSVATLRKASSFFGRSTRNRLHRASANKSQTSEETHGLYDALQEHIRPPTHLVDLLPETCTQADSHWRKEMHSDILNLPSQRLTNSISSTAGGSTIRTITHDNTAYRSNLPETIRELASPGPTTPSVTYDVDRYATPRAPPPSEEQIARRVKKVDKRWQTALDDVLPAERHLQYKGNPYELSSLDLRDHGNESYHIPCSATASISQSVLPLSGPAMLSPSVYSRATDGASPRADSPPDNAGTVITVTGREVRRYSISPPKPAQTKQENRSPSKEWRRWLSDEFRGFGQKTYEQYSLTNACSESSNTGSRVWPLTSKVNSPHQNCAAPRTDSDSPAAMSQPAARQDRPKLEGRTQSSFMNDRYPMIDGSRNSSGQSIASAARQASSALSNRRPENRLTPFTQDPDASEPDQGNLQSRVVIARQSIAALETLSRTKPENNPFNVTSATPLSATSDLPSAATELRSSLPKDVAAPRTRAQSAFDLRAKYRHNSQASARPLEVRRSTAVLANHARHDPTTPLRLDDDPTLQSIAAGPYASARREKENVTPDPTAGLPTLSSSEWLSPRTNKTNRRDLHAVHPALRERERDRAPASFREGRKEASFPSPRTAVKGGKQQHKGKKSHEAGPSSGGCSCCACAWCFIPKWIGLESECREPKRRTSLFGVFGKTRSFSQEVLIMRLQFLVSHCSIRCSSRKGGREAGLGFGDDLGITYLSTRKMTVRCSVEGLLAAWISSCAICLRLPSRRARFGAVKDLVRH
nr:annexin a11 [Quercus suber]